MSFKIARSLIVCAIGPATVAAFTSQGEDTACIPADQITGMNVSLTLMDCMERCRSADTRCNAIAFSPPMACTLWRNVVGSKSGLGSACYIKIIDQEDHVASTGLAKSPEMDIELQSSMTASGSWEQVPGSLIHVSAGSEFVWGVNSMHTIFKCRTPCNGGAWESVDGSLQQLDVGPAEVWGVNSAGNIYKRPADGSGVWKQVPGTLKHVSVGYWSVWGVNAADKIYRCTLPCSGAWIEVGGKLKQISIGRIGPNREEVWGVNAHNEIWAQPGDGSGAWRLVPGSLKYVSVSSGAPWVYGVNERDMIYRCEMPCSRGWTRIDGRLVQVKVASPRVWGVNRNGNIYRAYIPYDRRLGTVSSDGVNGASQANVAEMYV